MLCGSRIYPGNKISGVSEPRTTIRLMRTRLCSEARFVLTASLSTVELPELHLMGIAKVEGWHRLIMDGWWSSMRMVKRQV